MDNKVRRIGVLGPPANVALESGDIIYLPAKEKKGGGLLQTLTAISPIATLFSVF